MTPDDLAARVTATPTPTDEVIAIAATVIADLPGSLIDATDAIGEMLADPKVTGVAAVAGFYHYMGPIYGRLARASALVEAVATLMEGDDDPRARLGILDDGIGPGRYLDTYGEVLADIVTLVTLATGVLFDTPEGANALTLSVWAGDVDGRDLVTEAVRHLTDLALNVLGRD